ncbi:unnamed protein product [Schistocephalus solidus]|uniref:C2H2-type domain-containing protein n=1 Tax=Schistocephalus solidus TaxID=70667 RepID=A0A183SZP3_SCHSO|nr:unnamed protein product [Schistocephalus solidus]
MHEASHNGTDRKINVSPFVTQGERPYKCKFCHKAFSQNGTLKRHYQTCKVALARGEEVSSDSIACPAPAIALPQLHRPPSYSPANMETPQQPAAPFVETPNTTRGELFDLFKTESPLQHLPTALTQRINFPSLLNVALPSPAQANGYSDSALLGQKIEGTLRRLIFDKASFPAQRLPPMPGSLPPFGPFVPRAEGSALPRHAKVVGREEEEEEEDGRYTVEAEGPEDLSSSRIWEKEEEIQEGPNAGANRQATKISHSDTSGRWHSILPTNHRNQPRYQTAASFSRSLVPSSPHRPRSADAVGAPDLLSATDDVLDSLTRLRHLFECKACGLFFREKALWKTHNSLHGPSSEQDSFVCSLCGQCLSDACAFALHFAEDHYQNSPGALRNRSSGENSSEDRTIADCSQTPTKPTAFSSPSSSASSASLSVSTAFHSHCGQDTRIPTTVTLSKGPETHPVQGHTETRAPDKDGGRNIRSGYWLSYNTDTLDASSSPLRSELHMDIE